uniref:Uncharacterized protein n=1 Tax=Rhizophora mucronata TaxID=61149 RepID=A0A2P2NSY8_RHIMU
MCLRDKKSRHRQQVIGYTVMDNETELFKTEFGSKSNKMVKILDKLKRNHI